MVVGIESKFLRLTLAVLLGSLLTMSALAFSQTTEAPEVEAPEDTALTSIAIEDLPTASHRTAELIDDINVRLLADSTLLAISGLIPSAGDRADSLCSRTEELLASQPTLRRLRNLGNDWKGLIDELEGWQKALADRISAIGVEANELARVKQAWMMTEARAGLDRLPSEVVQAITRTVSDIEQTEGLLFERRNQLLLLNYQVAHLEAKCRNRIDLASTEADRMRARLLVADAAPLWSRAAISEADDRIGLKVRNTLGDHLHSLRDYIEGEPARVGIHLAIFVVSAICIAVLGRNARAHPESDRIMASAAEMLRQPIPAALLVAVLVDRAIHAEPPEAWIPMLYFLLLVPLLALGPRLLGRRFRAAVYILALVYVLDVVLEVLPQHSFTGRLLKLGVMVTLIITALWLMRRLYLPAGQVPGRRRQLATLALGAVVCVLVVSALAGVVGNVSLAAVLLDGTLESIYLGLLLWLSVLVLRSIVTVILKTNVIRRTGLVRTHGEGVRFGIVTTLKIAAILIWLTAALDAFKVLTPVYEGLKGALASSIKVGSLEVATGDIVLFLVIIWLSFLISRILRAILREEVFPRVRLAHGIPMAVDKLAHYIILIIGFFLAMAAAGIDLNRFTLLAGALGVGIGFGLQNIVSNIVSGIIVLFERPVQIGDKVRIGTNDGEIKSIGLRATVIRTWEGAEVIVPNSRLILDEVTNWTLSDKQRRVDVHVGVAYGSDTDKVTELLLKVAKDHKDVLEHPEASVLFTGFGDSSLNFTLRAWTGRFGDFLRVGSELTAAVNRGLAEAGITIPFPQRDVHMRSSDQDVRPD